MWRPGSASCCQPSAMTLTRLFRNSRRVATPSATPMVRQTHVTSEFRSHHVWSVHVCQSRTCHRQSSPSMALSPFVVGPRNSHLRNDRKPQRWNIFALVVLQRSASFPQTKKRSATPPERTSVFELWWLTHQRMSSSGNGFCTANNTPSEPAALNMQHCPVFPQRCARGGLFFWKILTVSNVCSAANFSLP